MISISDVSAAYASESELIQYEDRIFQMLLPSKSHRRHSNRSSPSKHSRHDTSTDSESFLVSPPITHSKYVQTLSFSIQWKQFNRETDKRLKGRSFGRNSYLIVQFTSVSRENWINGTECLLPISGFHCRTTTLYTLQAPEVTIYSL